MGRIRAAITFTVGMAGAAAAIALAPVAAAQPSGPTCTNINATTTQCVTNGSVAISTSPGTVAGPVWPYPYNDPWWGPSMMIGW